LTGFFFWTIAIVINVPIIKGPRAGAVRSEACGEVKTSVKQEAPPWSSSPIIDRQKKFIETYSKITRNAMKFNSFVMYRSIVSVNVYNIHYFKLRLNDDIDNNSILDNIAILQKLSPLV